ncbi:MAG: UbiA family prenyltransferase [Candidatus Aenigmatarchaeota archaeon]
MLAKEITRIFIHIRWPLQVYTFLGFIFGLLVAQVNFQFIVIVALASQLLLWAGVTLFNSYYDKDDKPVAGLKNPPKITNSILYGSLFFKIVSLILALFVNKIFLFITVFIIFLSVLYSHKKFRFKSNGFIALLFNFIAGFITFLSSSSIKGSGLLDKNIIFGSISAGLFLVSIYLMMQIHQTKDDKNRGDVSYIMMFGRKRALLTSVIIILFSGAFGLFSLYLSSLFMHIIILGIYMTVGIILLIKWLYNKKEDDFNMMTKITNYFSFVGFILLLLIYIFSG